MANKTKKHNSMEGINQEGIIEITRIENKGMNADQTGTLKALFVRYPGSQQLTVWLPESAWNGYGEYRIINLKSNYLIEQNQVTDTVSGSVKLVFNSICISPGEYVLEIEHPKGGNHVLYFNKLEENEKLPADKIVEMPMASKDNPSIYIVPLPIFDNMDWR
jgi:hypothetical protein